MALHARRSRSVWPATLALALALVGGACGDSSDDGTSAKKDSGTHDDAGSGDKDGAAGNDDAATGGQDSGTAMAQGMVTAAKGGMLESSDGAITLKFPAGAVAKDTTVTVREATADEAVKGFEAALGKIYVLEPAGTEFEKPVELVFLLDRDTVDAAAKKAFPKYVGGDNEAFLVALVGESEGKFTAAAEQTMDVFSDPDHVIVRGEVSHFSTWAALVGGASVAFFAADGGGTLSGPVGTVKAGRAVVTGGTVEIEAGLSATVAFQATEANVALAKTTGKLPNDTRSWKTESKCLDVGKGFITATFSATFNQLTKVTVTASVREPYDCTAKPEPTCTPTAPKPDAAPVFTALPESLDLCRMAKFFFDAQNASTGTACLEVGGAVVEIECSGSYCAGTVPQDAALGESAATLTTLAGSATSSNTLNVKTGAIPTVASLAPTSGQVGDTVTVTGTGFTDNSTVLTFSNDGSPPWTATLTRVSDTEATFVIPQGTPGGSFTLIYISSDACGTDTDPEPVTLSVASPG